MRQAQLSGLALVAGLALWGCGSGEKGGAYKPKAAEKIAPAVITEGQESEIMPFKVGNTWVYEATSTRALPQGTQSNTAEVTFKVTEVTETPDGPEAAIEVTSDGKVTDRLRWRHSAKGLVQVSGSSIDKPGAQPKVVTFNPPNVIVPYPPKPMTQVNNTGVGLRPGAGTGDYQSKATVNGVQEVDVMNGRMSALSTEEVMTYSREGLKYVTTSSGFWVPKIGLVRYIQEILLTNKEGSQMKATTILRLKSHQP